MRLAALTAGVLIVVLVTALAPADASPPLFPETQRETRDLVKASLDDAKALDRTGAAALREARLLLTSAKAMALRNGALDVRTTLTQPIVHASGDFASLVWAGAASADKPWRGAFWVETQDRVSAPNVLELDAEGSLFAVGEPALVPATHLDITYHFLGTDGKHIEVAAGRAEILGFLPEPQSPDFGAASLARENGKLVGAFLTPWNLLETSATMGISFAYATSAPSEFILQSCDDLESTSVEPGCRQLYPLMVEPDLVSVTLWHLGDDGERIDDRTLTYAELDAGYTFG